MLGKPSSIPMYTRTLVFCAAALVLWLALASPSRGRHGSLSRPIMVSKNRVLPNTVVNFDPKLLNHIPASYYTTVPSKIGIKRSDVFGVVDVKDVTDPTALKEKKMFKKKRDEFILNKGELIETIRYEIPRILEEAPSLELFRDDARLHVLLGGIGIDFELSGKQKYKTWFDRMRWTSKLALGWVEVSPCVIRPDVDPMSPYVRARWSITAYPRLFMQSSPIRIDFLSIFELDGSGKVKKHEITDIEDSSLRIPSVLRSLFLPAPAMVPELQSVTNNHEV